MGMFTNRPKVGAPAAGAPGTAASLAAVAATSAATLFETRVTVPPGGGPGAMVAVTGPDGQKYNVIVPDGVEAGQVFTAEVPTSSSPTAAASASTPAAQAAAPASAAVKESVPVPGKEESPPTGCIASIKEAYSSVIHTPEEGYKVLIITSFCFTANTILLLGRNIGATMLLTGLGAEAMPYCMVLVGVFVIIIMPIFAALAQRYSSNTVLLYTTFAMVAVLGLFMLLFVTGLAAKWPRVVYPLFFTLEEVIDSLLMVLFWQSARPHAPD